MATEKELRSKVATWGNAYKGIKEGSSEHKELINIFNNSGLCSRYKMTTSDAWCAMFVSDAFIACGLTDIFPCVECGCSNMITLAQKAGIWQEDDAYVPGIGDVVLYDWDDTTGSSKDNTGTPDHVGIVQSVSGSSFTVIEGNKSDTVGVRTMQINGKYIRGFITPNYAKAAGAETSSTGSTGSTTKSSGSTDSSGSSSNADSYDESLAGTYTVTANSGLNVRKAAGSSADKIVAIPKGTSVKCDGHYQTSGSTKWLYITFTYNSKSYSGYATSGYLKKASSSSSSSSSGSSSSSSSKKPSYKVGSTYHTQVDRLNVRTGAGTNYDTVGYNNLTSNGKLHAYSNGSLKKGTAVTCKAVKEVGSDIWIQIPSGWIAGYYKGDTYVS